MIRRGQLAKPESDYRSDYGAVHYTGAALCGGLRRGAAIVCRKRRGANRRRWAIAARVVSGGGPGCNRAG